MSGSLTQLGVKDESTYGTAVTVDHFHEIVSEGIQPDRKRIASKGLSSARVERNNRYGLVKKGAAGPIELEVFSKGFGFWLKHILGTVAAPAGPTDSAYTHVGTIGSLTGDSFTCQVGRPVSYSATPDTVQAFTFEGGKVNKAEFSCGIDGLLVCKLDCDFEDWATATALATQSLPTGVEPFPFSMLLTIGGSTIDTASSFKVTIENGLKVDRYRMKTTTAKKEPIENAKRKVTWELGLDFDAMTQVNRALAITQAGAEAAIVAKFSGATLIGASTYPSLQFDIPAAIFDPGDLPVSKGEEALEFTAKGEGLYDNTNSALKLTYVTLDATTA